MTPATYPTGKLPKKLNDNPQPDTWRTLRIEDEKEKAVRVRGLDGEYTDMLDELFDLWRAKLVNNQLRYRYYNGETHLKNIGIAIPPILRDRCEMVVGWPQKAVDALAVRSRFDGWTAADDDVQRMLDAISERSRLAQRYNQNAVSELIYGCSFATVGMVDGKARIDLYSAEQAAAVWDDAKGRIAYGMTIQRFSGGEPVEATLYTDDAMVRLWRTDGGYWDFEAEPYSMGRPAMEAFVYRPTYRKPFGQSRITGAVMSITDSAVRESFRTELSAEYFTSPQKYLLGADKKALNGQTKWEAYIGNIFAVSRDQNGDLPQFGQLPQGSMQPHTDYMRSLAARFAGETNVPLHMLGIVSDNPSSAEAIYAASEPLIIDAEDLNASARETLKSLALMCVAGELGVPLSELTDGQRDLSANFASPAMPSVVSQTDAAVKIASVVSEFAGTSSFWKMIGMPEDARREVEAEIRKNNAGNLLRSLFAESAGAEAAATTGEQAVEE